MYAITSPVPQFFDLSGDPLDAGKIYIGTAGSNPITSPVAVYWDEAGTQPAAQPIRTVSGYPARNGKPARVYVGTDDFSMAVMTRSDVVVTTELSVLSSATLRADLAATGGSALVGFQQAGAGAITMTAQDDLRARLVTPQQFGAVGDNTADDSNALEAMFATGLPWEIPYTASGYKISRQLTINASGVCHGFIKPTTAVGANACFVIAASGYSTKRFIGGLRVVGDVTVRAAGVRGIQVDAPIAVLERCSALQLDYGLVVRAYSVTLRDCHSHQCNTNLSAYARSFLTEINALTIDGGQYDSAVNVALNIGDASWPDALAAGNSHGVVINIINGVSTDGAESRIDNVGTVNIIGTYAETTNTDCLWRLGGSGDGNIRGVKISGNFFKSARYAVKCLSGVAGLEVGQNFLSGITSCEIKLSTDLYSVVHREGTYAGCFGEGTRVGLAYRSLPIANITFDGVTIEADFLAKGIQSAQSERSKYYPGGTVTVSGGLARNITTSAGSVYASPASGKAGTVSGTVFAFTTKADCFAFNGGDRITTVPAGATYVRSVDYAAGTMVIDGGITASGAATVSQTQAVMSAQIVSFAAPITGNWTKGDRAFNSNPAVGQPKSWVCTVSGTPGTWVSEGNL